MVFTPACIFVKNSVCTFWLVLNNETEPAFFAVADAPLLLTISVAANRNCVRLLASVEMAERTAYPEYSLEQVDNIFLESEQVSGHFCPCLFPPAMHDSL